MKSIHFEQAKTKAVASAKKVCFFALIKFCTFWRGIAADLSVFFLVAGVSSLFILPTGARSYGWIFIVAGIVFIFFSSRAILRPTSLWQFFVAFCSITAGYKMLATGKMPL